MLFQIVRFYLLLPALIGLLSGLLVLAFVLTIHLVIALVLKGVLGFKVPSPPGLTRPFSFEVESVLPFFFLPAVVLVGVVLAEVLILLFAKEAQGMSADTVIQAYHRRLRLSFKTSVVKLLASALVIGSGGTAGRLAPSALIGSGVADSISRLFRLSPSERRVFIAVGFGAGLSAVLKAPLAGAIMSAEIFFKRDFEAQALLPSFVASVVSYSVFGSVYGFDPLFRVSTPPFSEMKVSHLFLFIGLALFCTLGVKAFVLLFSKTRDFTNRILKDPLTRVSLGALVSGFMGLVSPMAVAGGLGWVQTLLDGEHLSPMFLLLSMLAVAVGVSFLIGSGGSGGVFGPSLLLGALVGALYGVLAENFTEVHLPSLVVVGMTSFLAGVVNAPLSNIILVSEITGGYELLVPSMVSVFITYILTSKETVFPSQVDTRLESPSHQNDLGMFILEKLKVGDYMSDPITVRPDDSLKRAKKLMEENMIGGLPVVSGSYLVGIITKSDIMGLSEAQLEKLRVYEAMTREVFVITPENTLAQALNLMVSKGVGRLPVVEKRGSRTLVGIIARADIGRAIRENITSKS
ncbi:MAG: CBS domain-containing protein [Aquificae bacterium]|nr:CBS domain-containing protein [Aquificota bacterium]